MLPNPAFWNDRRVLVTGHTGFKGAWLSLWLTRMGARVTGLALDPPTDPSLYALANVGSVVRSLRGDIRDPSVLRSVVAEHKPEVVLHLAARSLVRESYEDPLGTYAVNVLGTAAMLDAVRLHPGAVRAVLVVTSDKCYDNREWLWGYREDEPMGGADPYSSSKGCAELVTAAYRRSYFPVAEYERHRVAIASARAGNVFGGGDWARDRLLPDLMRALGTGRQAFVRNPNAVRPWQHVLEPLAGYLLLCERLVTDGPLFSEGWNFGPPAEEAWPVSAVAAAVCKHWGAGAQWSKPDQQGPQPHEAHNLRLDSTKARTRLQWQPKLSLEEALGWTAQWYRAQGEGADTRTLTEQQLDRYVRQEVFT